LSTKSICKIDYAASCGRHLPAAAVALLLDTLLLPFLMSTIKKNYTGMPFIDRTAIL
jgi:uncharacterized protein YceK